MTQKIYPLSCKAQQYAWGKVGLDSTVAKLLVASGFEVDKEKPYAEFWMGTHPSGASEIVYDQSSSTPLLSILSPDTLGKNVAKHWHGDLPFLFKVLSVRTSLSIQAHPDISLAKQLHSSFPDIYKDPNHKPEMALALTQFHALCRFRNSREISQYLDEFPEFKMIIGDEITQNFQQHKDSPNKIVLKELYTALMRSSAEITQTQIERLLSRLKEKENLSSIEKLMITLNTQFPGDIGVFSPLVLNYITLEPGQAIFLAPNEPHAYISGDCIECMATSDNVVRAGLTPKYKDVNTLLNMLTYEQGSPSKMDGIFSGNIKDAIIRTYRPPIDEFQVEMIQVNTNYTIESKVGPSIILIFEGKGVITPIHERDIVLEISKGKCFFIPNHSVLEIKNTAHSPLIIYKAAVNDTFSFSSL
eukprot:TRINITY_DN457_c0_g2_i1.p1 TRINITY_DN457_c0_g2~~TRINITY_DN457_c0_g2_i1.p1  ORF type:complete len:416 (+),score=72.97 TRINITY_DN457_c0_g2_i1:304-1551(+)